MRAIVVTPKNKNEFEFLSRLLHKLNISSKELSSEEIEDIGLSILMREADRTKKVSKDTILKKLSE